MKLTRYRGKVLFLLFIGLIATSLAFGQDKKESTNNDGITRLPDGSYRSKDLNEATRPDDSYLAKFHATEVVRKLMKKNLDQVYMLKVIVSNYKEKADWKTKYDNVYNGYKGGMGQYYKRNLIYARLKLEKNKKDIGEFYKIIISEYQKEAESMLNECATKVLSLSLDVANRTDPNRFEQLHHNHERLRIAYSQVDDAIYSLTNHYYMGAIYHLRVAKSYAITILEDLAKKEERDQITKKYEKLKADNLNRIYEPAKSDIKK